MSLDARHHVSDKPTPVNAGLEAAQWNVNLADRGDNRLAKPAGNSPAANPVDSSAAASQHNSDAGTSRFVHDMLHGFSLSGGHDSAQAPAAPGAGASDQSAAPRAGARPQDADNSPKSGIQEAAGSTMPTPVDGTKISGGRPVDGPGAQSLKGSDAPPQKVGAEPMYNATPVGASTHQAGRMAPPPYQEVR